MTRITAKFTGLKEKGEKALVAFITAGDPDIETTESLIVELEGAGADIIELGIPFSDPMADGPTIQASSERALARGVTLKDVLALVERARKKTDIPIVLFGYYNPIFAFGLRRFARAARAAGADGVLVVDLPPEEADELKCELDSVGLDMIFLLTPTSDSRRMRLAAQKGSGFVYYVSLTGVTGARKKLSADIPGYVKRIRRFTDLPVGVGFGISTPEQAARVGRSADGVIVGSAIVNVIARGSGGKNLVADVAEFVASLKKGLTGAHGRAGARRPGR
ncbi:MAG: tryptophan synthase subunit alpha [Thermodesulfobacteriota bacterium]